MTRSYRWISVLSLVVVCLSASSVARADAYGKNLLLLNKALRDGNCEQAYEAADRLVREEPDRPDAHVYLGDALLCLDRPWEALTAYLAYRDRGGRDDVAERIEDAVDGMPRVILALRAFEVPEPTPYGRWSDFSEVPLTTPPDDATCTVEGVPPEVQEFVVEKLAHGFAVRVPPFRNTTLEVSAEGFERTLLIVNSPSPRDKPKATAELRRGGVDAPGSWVFSGLEAYDARLVVGDQTYRLTGDPIWVPPGSYELSIAARVAPGLEVLRESLTVPDEAAGTFDVTGHRQQQLDLLHGDVGVSREDSGYQIELHWKLPGHEGQTTSLSPGKKAHILTGPYRLQLYRVVRTADGESDPVMVVEEEGNLNVRADRVTRMPTESMLRHARANWFAQLRIAELPESSILRLDDELAGSPDDRGLIHLALDPGPHDLVVLAPWRERWQSTVRLESTELGEVRFDAPFVASYERARKLRTGGTISLIASGVSLVTSLVLGAVYEYQYQSAVNADEAYHRITGSSTSEYARLDALRRHHASQADAAGAAAGVFLGVGFAAGGAGLTLHIVAPRDPNRQELRSLWGHNP